MLRPALVLACVLLGLFLPAAASAATTTQILRDCADDGVLQGDYKPSELRKARQNIPADTDEYTDCRDVLARAAAAGVARSSGSGGDGSGGGGGAPNEPPADPDSPEGRAIVGGAGAKPPPGPIDIGGRPVIPGEAGLVANGVRNDLPAGLLVLMILLGAGALAATLPSVRRNVLARFRR